jgi:hypothetical protein
MVDREQTKPGSTSQVESSVGNWGASGSGASARGSGGTAGDVKQQVGEVADQVKGQAAQLKDTVAETATGKLEEQKTQATSGLGNVSEAIRQTGQQLRSNDQEAIAQYVDRAAEQLDQFTGYLRSRDMRQLVGDVEAFARREPALFLGGAFVLGLFGARFLKSSSGAIETRGSDWRGGQGEGVRAALSSYSSYASMLHTQRIPVQYDERPSDTPTGDTSSPTPTPTAAGGTPSLGTGGSLTPTRQDGGAQKDGGTPPSSTSSREGAPSWQGGATPPEYPSDSVRGASGRESSSGMFTARQGRQGDSASNTRSGGDAGA